MQFLKGFQKTASLDTHSDGSEFKRSDGEPTSYGPGAPSLSSAASNPASGPDTQQKKKMSKINEAAQLAIGKLGSANMGAIDGIGTKSDIADTTVDQLKWDTTTPDTVRDKPKQVKRGFLKGVKK